MLTQSLLDYADNVALVDDSGVSVTYRDLLNNAHEFVSEISQERSLVIIEADCLFDTIYAYLGCLSLGHVPLMVDGTLADELKALLIDTFQPNYIARGGELKLYSRKRHSFHQDVALLLSTSGSTGSPKLVKLSHANIEANALSIADYLSLTPVDRAITNLPLHYSYGLSILNSHLITGGSIVVTNETLFSKTFWQLVKEHEVTSLVGVPYTYSMYKRLRLQTMDLPSIRYMTQAGGKMSELMVNEFQSLCHEKGWELFIMYGQTEATARMSYLHPSKVASKTGSVGQAISGGKFEILSSGNDRTGEVVYKGPNVMLGYATTPADFALPDTLNGILHTGDIGYLDQDGDLYITGRSSRFIKLFGLRFNLDQVEELLRNLDFDVAVGGEDDLMRVVTTQKTSIEEIKSVLIDKYKLNHRAVSVVHVDMITTKVSGKVDYQAIFGS